MSLENQIENIFGLQGVACKNLNTPTNDVVLVTAASGKYALKIYSVTRTADEVKWEVDFITHLVENGAPVVKPVSGRHGYVTSVAVDGKDRIAVLYEWARGEKPSAKRDTYHLLGQVAARIHQAADTFSSALVREKYDAAILIDDQLQRMKPLLIDAGRWPQSVALGERLKRIVANPALDHGVCHMDLTLDNVHRDGNVITVFDFDSAGECWRALEPHGVLKFSKEYFAAWMEGYRTIRPFDRQNEEAVAAFCIIGNLRVVAWDLGVARSSRGKPLLDTAGLTGVVDGWLEWERQIGIISP
jgi:Ser/Thr protein kinase RdoA (MazF antagonist)